MMWGNTGVTQTYAIERGKLRRDEACEDKENRRGKLCELLSEAGVGELPQY
jgi:hypothetical protein